jgi:hypothetical protein
MYNFLFSLRFGVPSRFLAVLLIIILLYLKIECNTKKSLTHEDKNEESRQKEWGIIIYI